MSWKRYLPILVVVVVAVIIQLLLSAAGALYFLTQLTMSAYYSVVVIGLCLLMGYTGQISLGHAGFFAIGGYTSAVITTFNLLPYAESGFVGFLKRSGLALGRFDLYGEEILYVSPWIAFAAAIFSSTSWIILLALGRSCPDRLFVIRALAFFVRFWLSWYCWDW